LKEIKTQAKLSRLLEAPGWHLGCKTTPALPGLMLHLLSTFSAGTDDSHSALITGCSSAIFSRA